VGFLLAPVAYEVVRSRRQTLQEFDPGVVNELVAAMQAEALDVVRQGAGSGVAETDLTESRHAYMRYVGQGHEISVALPVERYGEGHREVFKSCFEAAYRQLYGRIIEGVEVEALSWTLTIATAGSGHIEPVGVGALDAVSAPEPIGRQPLIDPGSGAPAEAPVYLRRDLPTGARLSGPALITEDQTTTVVTAGWRAAIDSQGSIVLTRKGRADAELNGGAET
jgi:N-methylhydantoinase A